MSSAAPAPTVDHRVQFYESDRAQAATVAAFAIAGLRAGDGVALIMTAEHAVAVRAEIAEAGIDAAAASADGRLVIGDARELLATFLVDGRPDRERFVEVIGGIVDRLIARCRRVRAYGEMVDLLCADDEREAMLALEELWSDLLAARPAALLCGYRLDRFARGGDAADFARVCAAHAHVHAAHGADAGDDDATRRRIAALQQQAIALRSEIAERERVERELRASEERSTRRAAELEAANRELERFAYVCAHDLKEPLRMVTQYMGLLRRRYGAGIDADAARCVAYAVEGAERMQALIDGLLRYSAAAERTALTRVALDEQLDEVLDDLAAPIGAAGATVTRAPLPRVLGDESGLRDVLRQLVDNAVKFHGERPPRIAIAARDDGDAWTITVRDEGIGIAPRDLERVFGVLQRLHPRTTHPGTGIGLAIARRIVERHGGRLWAESTPDAGSAFHVSLPKLPAPAGDVCAPR